MIQRVISGGQMGADLAGWRAAKAAGIATGGMMPRGFRTETPNGQGWGEVHPEFRDLYGARQFWTDRYEDRTPINVCLADGTILFGNPDSPGGRLVQKIERNLRRDDPARPPVFEVARWDGSIDDPNAASWWIAEGAIRVLHVAGNRESRSPGIGAWVEEYLAEVFRLLKAAPGPNP
jgi:hypothetical protein